MNISKNIILKFLFAAVVAIIVISVNAQPPAGYYNNANNKTCAALKTALKTIINTGNNPKSYSALWNQYILTDIKPRTIGTGSANVIYDMYSAIPGGTDPYQFTPGPVASGGQQDNGTLGTAEGQLYNKEHGVPKSWYNGNTSVNGIATDYLYVIPADKYINGKRGEMPYGKVATVSQTFMNGGKIGTSAVAGITGDAANKVFEPIDSFKGDAARAFFYFLTMYEDNLPTLATNTTAAQCLAYNTFPSITIPYLQLMLQWHRLDPVSSKEKTRNNGAYSFQGNRNPFIDHPEWVDSVWNAACPGLSALPVNFTFFTGVVNNNILRLSWTINSEVNVKNYEIEQSSNGSQFTTIGKVEAQHLQDYSFNINIDDIKGRRVYYRIKNVDNNGKFSYSEVFTIHIPTGIKMSVYPNPAIDNINLQINTSENLKVVVTIADFAGKVVLQKNGLLSNGLINISTSGIANGTYLLQVKTNTNFISSKLIINR